MLAIISSIGTIFLLIMLGYGLRYKSIPSEEYWQYADKLVYWVLFPCFLFYKISIIKLAPQLIPEISGTLLPGMLIAVAFAWVVSRWFKLNSKACSSVVQAAGRHNTFIALAIAESLFGEQGLLLATLATAILVPFTNIIIVVLMVIILHTGEQHWAKKIASDLVRNPILIAIFLGFAVNLSGVGTLPVIHPATSLLGSATLPIVLLCIGASMQFKGLKQTFSALMISSLAKFMVFPAVVLLLLISLEVNPEIAMILMIYASTPTAASGFALARQMGGDYKLMASLISNQTLFSFLTMPVTIYFSLKLLGLEIL